MVALSAYPQPFSVGPRAGIISSRLKIKAYKEDFSSLKSELGYHGGVFVRFSLGSWYLQPEGLITAARNKFDIKQAGPQKTIKLRFRRLGHYCYARAYFCC